MAFCVKDWTEALDEAISKFVRLSKSVRSILVFVRHDYSGATTASKRFTESVDSGERSLEKFCVLKIMPWGCHHYLWGDELCLTLRLNRMRHMYGGLFERVVRAETAQERHQESAFVLEAVGMDVLYEFVRRDEWGLQDIAKEFALVASPADDS